MRLGLLESKIDNLSKLEAKTDELISLIQTLNKKADENAALLSSYILREMQEGKINTEPMQIEKYVTDPAVVLHKLKYGVCDFTSEPQDSLISSIARLQDLYTYKRWVSEMGIDENFFHRKVWEHVYIAQALSERGMLSSGKKGLVFAVGSEPLPALFAKYGVKVTASDLDESNTVTDAWKETNQHSTSLLQLERPNICDKEMFYENVTFVPIDMNNIPNDLTDYDFCWSSCAFEHCGDLQKCREFVFNSLKVLKPGGMSVHTTEYNISSEESVDIPYQAAFGKHFLDNLRDELISLGHDVAPFDFRLGNHPDEDYVSPGGDNHFKLRNFDSVTTSIGLIIKKAK